MVLNRFGRIPFLGFDRVGDWPNVWTTEIRTDRNGFGFDLIGLGQIKANLKQLALPGLRLLMGFRLPVPYNGGLDPAGTRRKFVSLKLECRQSAFKKSRTDQDASGMHFFGERSKHSMVARVLPVGY